MYCALVEKYKILYMTRHNIALRHTRKLKFINTLLLLLYGKIPHQRTSFTHYYIYIYS